MEMGHETHGICINVVTKVEKPKPLMMIVPKFEMPPLGTLQTQPRRKKSGVFMSVNVSLTWYHLKCLFSTPV